MSQQQPLVAATTQAAVAPSCTSIYTDVVQQDSYPTLHSILMATDDPQDDYFYNGSNNKDIQRDQVIYDLLYGVEQITSLLRSTLVYVEPDRSGNTPTNVSTNEFGDVQLSVDMKADRILWDMAKQSTVIAYAASEEDPVLRDVVVSTNTTSTTTSTTHRDTSTTENGYIVCWDPLDGSSIVDNNWAVGTIFGVWPSVDTTATTKTDSDDTTSSSNATTFFNGTTTGRHQVTSMVAMYGPRTTVLVALPDGTYEFTYGCSNHDHNNNNNMNPATVEETGSTASTTMQDSDDEEQRRRRRVDHTGQNWVCTRQEIRIDPLSRCRLFSPANLRVTQDLDWYRNVVQYYMSERYTLRYTGGLVPDIYQQFTKGMGIYMNPISPNSPAKLRLIFEVAPIALLIEKAGGTTSDCCCSRNDGTNEQQQQYQQDMQIQSILDIPIVSIDQRSALCCGTTNEVMRFHTMMEEGMTHDKAKKKIHLNR